MFLAWTASGIPDIATDQKAPIIDITVYHWGTMMIHDIRSGTHFFLKSMLIKLWFQFITGQLVMTVNRGK